MSTFVATDPVGYETYIGRWSQRLARPFVEFAGVAAGERVLDVGCGTGHLTRALAEANATATGVDLSAAYVEHARRRVTDTRATFEVGDALNLAYPTGAFDRSVSMLALDVFPEPTRALAEMRRVTRSSGTVAALVPDFRCGFPPFFMLCDIAATLDPRAVAMRDEFTRKPMGWAGGLEALFQAAGLIDVTPGRLSVLFDYASFDDYWASFLTGQGKVGGYVMSLSDAKRKDLERHARGAYLSGMPDGRRPFTVAFHVARGMVPA